MCLLTPLRLLADGRIKFHIGKQYTIYMILGAIFHRKQWDIDEPYVVSNDGWFYDHCQNVCQVLQVKLRTLNENPMKCR